jgi:hypothetical protein
MPARTCRHMGRHQADVLQSCLCIAFCVLLVACGAPEPTALPTPTPTTQPTLSPTLTASPTPSATRIAVPTPQRPIPTATPSPAATPSPTATPATAWAYWPNMLDLRDVAIDDDRLWIASLSGLLQYRPADRTWQAWTTADGLIDNTCESVVLWHDQIWVGTQSGVSRYDPATGGWQSYTMAGGLPGVGNSRLYVDPHADVLWAATLQGLAAYDAQNDRWAPQQHQDAAFAGVRQFAADPDFLWTSVECQARPGIWRLHKATGSWEHVSANPGAPPPGQYALSSDQAHLWAWNTEGVLYEHDSLTGTWTVRSVSLGEAPLIPPVLSYRAPELWVGTTQGWAHFSPETPRVTHVPYPLGDALTPQGIPRFTQRAAWIPTKSGLYALDLSDHVWSRHAPTDWPEAIERVLLAGQDELLVSTGRQLGHLAPRKGYWHPLPPVPADLPWAMSTAARQPGTPGLWVYVPPIGTPSPDVQLAVWHYEDSNAPPRAIQVPRDYAPARLLPRVDGGQLWFHSGKAVISYGLDTGRWQRHPVGGKAGNLGIAAQEPGSIWLIKGGETLVRFDTVQRHFQVYPVPMGVAWRHVAFTEDTIWLAGESSEMLAFGRADRRWTKHVLDRDCIGHGLSALAAHGAVVWVGGESGIIRFDSHTGHQVCYAGDSDMLAETVTQIVVNGDWVWFIHPWRGLWGYGPSWETQH